jgi:hypothetical protein
MTLQLHTPLATTRAFDAAEANYKITTQIDAAVKGKAQFTHPDLNGGAAAWYQFTVPAGNFAVGGLLRITAANSMTYYSTATASGAAVTLEAVTDGSDVTASLSAENNSTRVKYGSNRWSHSGIRQYLNSSAVAGSWWTSKNDYDLPASYASSVAGFLNGMDADFLAVVGNITKRTALNTVTDGATTNATDGDIGANDYEDLTERFFLLSKNEVNGTKENRIPEGEPYTYYAANGAETADAVAWRIKYSAVPAAVAWWLRSPSSTGSGDARVVYATGQVSSYYAHYSLGVAPACVIW